MHTNGPKLFQFPLKEGTVAHSLCFAANSRYLLSGGTDHVVSLWDLKKNARILTFEGHNDTITSVLFGAKDQLVFSGSRSGNILAHTIAPGTTPITVASASMGAVNDLAIDPVQRKSLVAGLESGYLTSWDVSRLSISSFDSESRAADISELTRPIALPHKLSSSSSSSLVTSSSSLSTGSSRYRSSIGSTLSPVTCLAFQPNSSDILAVGSRLRPLTLVDFRVPYSSALVSQGSDQRLVMTAPVEPDPHLVSLDWFDTDAAQSTSVTTAGVISGANLIVAATPLGYVNVYDTRMGLAVVDRIRGTATLGGESLHDESSKRKLLSGNQIFCVRAVRSSKGQPSAPGTSTLTTNAGEVADKAGVQTNSTLTAQRVVAELGASQRNIPVADASTNSTSAATAASSTLYTKSSELRELTQTTETKMSASTDLSAVPGTPSRREQSRPPLTPQSMHESASSPQVLQELRAELLGDLDERDAHLMAKMREMIAGAVASAFASQAAGSQTVSVRALPSAATTTRPTAKTNTGPLEQRIAVLEEMLEAQRNETQGLRREMEAFRTHVHEWVTAVHLDVLREFHQLRTEQSTQGSRTAETLEIVARRLDALCSTLAPQSGLPL